MSPSSAPLPQVSHQPVSHQTGSERGPVMEPGSGQGSGMEPEGVSPVMLAPAWWGTGKLPVVLFISTEEATFAGSAGGGAVLKASTGAAQGTHIEGAAAQKAGTGTGWRAGIGKQHWKRRTGSQHRRNRSGSQHRALCEAVTQVVGPPAAGCWAGAEGTRKSSHQEEDQSLQGICQLIFLNNLMPVLCCIFEVCLN
ncbi:hypothetical protein SRHO_G00079260 [Serrasalmus rhombeus]